MIKSNNKEGNVYKTCEINNKKVGSNQENSKTRQVN